MVTRFRYVFKASKHSEKHQNQSQITKINYLKKIKVLSKHQKNLKKHDEALGDIKKYKETGLTFFILSQGAKTPHLK